MSQLTSRQSALPHWWGMKDGGYISISTFNSGRTDALRLQQFNAAVSAVYNFLSENGVATIPWSLE